MKLKTDENLPTETAAFLRSAGHDAVSVLDQALGGAVDGRVAEVCREEKRALVTLDVGFANIVAYPPSQYAGFLVLRLAHQETERVLAALRTIVPLLESEPLEGRLWI